MIRFANHRIAIIGIAVLLFLVVASAASGQSASEKKKAEDSNKRGFDYYKKGNYDQAIAEYTEAIRLNPKFSEAYIMRGLAYSQKKDYDLAIADYDKAIQLDPKDKWAYIGRGSNYDDIGNYDHAIADFDKAIQLDQKFALAYKNRARIYRLKKDFTRAISDANQAVSLDPNNEINLITRGLAYLGNGDYDKAIADFEKSLQIDSNNTSAKEGLAQARMARITPEPVKDDDFEVKQNKDNTLTITGYKGTARNLVIPDKLYGLKVTIIGNRAFQNKGLISVVIPDTVVTIENGYYGDHGAFMNNSDLIKVTLGKGIKTIGVSAFQSCGQLTEIIIPDFVTGIGDSSFEGPSGKVGSLVKVTLGKGLQTIGSNAFRNNQITEINFPSSLKEIEQYAFSGNKIQKLTVGTSLQTIGREAFRNNQITEIIFILPTSLKTIYYGTFADNQIQSLTIPNGITYIQTGNYLDKGAFEDNPLTTVVIPASLVNGISVQSFGKINGSAITRITIPEKMDEKTLKNNFEEAFVNFWINQNKAGGTYVKRGPIWAKE